MNNILKKINFVVLFVFVFTFIFAFLISLFQLNPLIDTGREFYLSYRVLNGEVLYKDIFNIYGPLSYQINAFAYKMFGANINSLRIFGSLNSALIMVSVYLIIKEFFVEKTKGNSLRTFLLWLCPLILGVFYTGTFNYTVPYAFAMTYGLCFFLFSLLFFIKFSKSENINFLFWSAVFAGGAVTCKYEFFAYLVFLFIYALFALKNKRKIFLISLLTASVIPLISFGTLFLQGMTLGDLTNTFKIQKIMSQTDAIKYLYSNFTGTYFNIRVFGYCLLKTVLALALVVILYFADKYYSNDKILFPTTMLFVIFGIVYIGFDSFSLFSILNLVLFLSFIKKIYQNKPLFILLFSIILLSLKTFFAINFDVYGTYILPFILISFGIFLYNIDFVSDESLKQRIIRVFAAVIIIPVFCMSGFKTIIGVYSKISGRIGVEQIKNQNSFIENIRKNVYTNPKLAKTINETTDFIYKNTSSEDKIVVLPETQFLNFVTKRPADNLYDSLTPLYFETFGEENIISHFSQTRPEYFILNNRDTSDYGKKYICENYGQNFCKFIKKDYEKIKEIGDNKYKLQIFRRIESE